MTDLNSNYAASGFPMRGATEFGANPALLVIDVCEVNNLTSGRHRVYFDNKVGISHSRQSIVCERSVPHRAEINRESHYTISGGKGANHFHQSKNDFLGLSC
jgi:hypothetical protein